MMDVVGDRSGVARIRREVPQVSAVADVLRIEELGTDGVWLPLPVSDELAMAYAETTGWPTDQPAAGWTIVVGRLALTRGGRPLPPGGVLLEIAVTSFAAPPVDGHWEFRVATTVAQHRSGLPTVTAAVALRERCGADIAELLFTLRWPEAA